MITRTGRWSEVLHAPARIPSTLPPLSEGRAVDDEVEMERRYCADLSRRMLEFELDAINFFKMPRGSGFR